VVRNDGVAAVDSTAASAPLLLPAPAPAVATSAEIAVALGIIERNVRRRAQKECWPYTEQSVRGGRRRLYAISQLPVDVRDALARRAILTSVPALPTQQTPSPAFLSSVPAVLRAAPLSSEAQSGGLTLWQCRVRDARKAVLDAVAATAKTHGLNAAIREMLELSRTGTLPPHLAQAVPVANARRGSNGARTLSRSCVMQWHKLLRERGVNALAPKTPPRKYMPDQDVAAVFAAILTPNKPALRAAAREVASALGHADHMPLYYRALRHKRLLPQSLFHKGRHTGAALRALEGFRRRQFLHLQPNDIWCGDGHTFKAKVAHPDTGKPFAPEITLIIDVGQRYVVGWSVSLSENCIAVSDALRDSVARHGVPLYYYSDGGGGQKNKMFDAPLTGILPALDIEHEVGLPHNPQARGVIERIWRTITIPLAKRFPTYQGADADRDTLRLVRAEINRAMTAQRRGDVVALPAKLPTWRHFTAQLEAAVIDYNGTHRHSELPKLDGVNHATPAEMRAARLAESGITLDRPSPEVLATLFMPAEIRRVVRSEVRLFHGKYFHEDLYHLAEGEEVKVHYDVRDHTSVRVCRLTGEFIAKAILDGNASGFMPKPKLEQKREERAERRIKSAMNKIEDARAELAGGNVIDGQALRVRQAAAVKATASNVTEVIELPQAADARPMFRARPEKYRWLMARPEKVTEDDRAWIAEYRETGEYRDLFGDEEGNAGEGATARTS
jgi:putative transposase